MIGVDTRRRSSPAVTAQREVLYASRWLCVQRLRRRPLNQKAAGSLRSARATRSA
jgi:hypothetical protein